VTTKDFKYLKGLFLECLRENTDIEKQLDSYYKRIQVYFFYEKTDQEVEKSVREFLKNPEYTCSPRPSPGLATSYKGFGCVCFFLKHLMDFTKKRIDIQDVKAYHKNGVFEEICHLVEQKGDSSVHPESHWILWNLYRNANKLELGSEIVENLDTNRNHYEVYLMIIKAYPEEWVERFWMFFMDETPAVYERTYEQWKKSNTPIDIVYGRLITDTLKVIDVLYVANKVPKEKILNKHRKSLNTLIKTGKAHIKKKKALIEKDMGLDALTLIDSLDESIFKTPAIFFSIVLDLWKSLHLV